jgi:hypothetical protein
MRRNTPQVKNASKRGRDFVTFIYSSTFAYVFEGAVTSQALLKANPKSRPTVLPSNSGGFSQVTLCEPVHGAVAFMMDHTTWLSGMYKYLFQRNIVTEHVPQNL